MSFPARIDDHPPVHEQAVTAATSVTVPFPVLEPGDLLVDVNGVALDPSSYTVTLAADRTSATVQFASPVTGTVRVIRRTPLQAEARLDPAIPRVDVAALNRTISRLLLAVQEARTQLTELPQPPKPAYSAKIHEIFTSATIGAGEGLLGVSGQTVELRTLVVRSGDPTLTFARSTPAGTVFEILVDPASECYFATEGGALQVRDEPWTKPTAAAAPSGKWRRITATVAGTTEHGGPLVLLSGDVMSVSVSYDDSLFAIFPGDVVIQQTLSVGGQLDAGSIGMHRLIELDVTQGRPLTVFDSGLRLVLRNTAPIALDVFTSTFQPGCWCELVHLGSADVELRPNGDAGHAWTLQPLSPPQVKGATLRVVGPSASPLLLVEEWTGELL